jgi:hypothetical protein
MVKDLARIWSHCRTDLDWGFDTVREKVQYYARIVAQGGHNLLEVHR